GVTCRTSTERWSTTGSGARFATYRRMRSWRGKFMSTSKAMNPKSVRESQSELSELALPNDANGLGNLLGGKLMHLMDIAGSLAAARHARTFVVTAAFDHMSFLSPVRIGQLVLLRSSVNRVFRTSMEVGVKAFVEDLLTGERKHVASAYLT